jgi:hypothetical protein
MIRKVFGEAVGRRKFQEKYVNPAGALLLVGEFRMLVKIPAPALQFREEGGGLPDDPVVKAGGAGHGEFQVSS